MRGKRLMMGDAELIRVFAEFGFRTGQLAREYDVHPDTIRNIVKGASFKPGGRGGRGPNKKRKLNEGQVRQIREWAAEGHGEQTISMKLDGVIRRSTVRQVIDGKTYKDVK